MTILNVLEQHVLAKLLEGQHRTLLILRSQLEKLAVRDRQMTGVGFYTTFAVQSGILPVGNNLSFSLSNVYAEVPELRNGLGFTLFVKDGLIDMLEGYTYEEPWPPNLGKFKLGYIRDPEDFDSNRLLR